MEKYNKVAQITLYFWIMKILATTLGETMGDLLSMTLHLGYLSGIVISISFFLIVFILQIRSSTFHIVLYWLVIVGTTTAGTEISDFMDRSLNLGYAMGSLILFSILLIILGIWKLTEKNIQIYPILNKRIEIFYWLAILSSNTLGTAFGDFLSDDIGLSYINGAMITAAIIGIVVLLHYYSQFSPIFLFWIAFVFTRPFGATFGDFLTKPITSGGMNLGTIPSTIVSIILLAFVMIYSYQKEKRMKQNSTLN